MIAVLVERALERGEVGDVAGDVRDRRERVASSSRSRSRRGSVERSKVATSSPVVDELVHDPGADAAVGAGDEKALASLMTARG